MVKTKQLIHELSKSLRWQNFIFLFVAGCINAFGVNIFLAPVGLYDSGISGTSILLSQITPDYLSLSVFLLILNVPLFLFGLKKQGTAFTVYSLFAVAVYSAASWIIVDVLPVQRYDGSDESARQGTEGCNFVSGLGSEEKCH